MRERTFIRTVLYNGNPLVQYGKLEQSRCLFLPHDFEGALTERGTTLEPGNGLHVFLEDNHISIYYHEGPEGIQGYYRPVHAHEPDGLSIELPHGYCDALSILPGDYVELTFLDYAIRVRPVWRGVYGWRDFALKEGVTPEDLQGFIGESMAQAHESITRLQFWTDCCARAQGELVRMTTECTDVEMLDTYRSIVTLLEDVKRGDCENEQLPVSADSEKG